MAKYVLIGYHKGDHRIQKYDWGLSLQIHISEFPWQCPPIVPEAVLGLEETGRRLSPYVLYSFFIDNLKKQNGSIWVVKIVVWRSHRPRP
jgi:hypothetical protein